MSRDLWSAGPQVDYSPLLANPRNPAMSPTRPGTCHTDLVSGDVLKLAKLKGGRDGEEEIYSARNKYLDKASSTQRGICSNLVPRAFKPWPRLLKYSKNRGVFCHETHDEMAFFGGWF